MKLQRCLVLLAVTSMVGCTQNRLVPTPGATETVAGPGIGAVAIEQGVRVEMRTQAWTGQPQELGTSVTPVLVQIDNRSTVPMRIRFSDFAILTPSNKVYAAIPPFAMDSQQVTVVTSPAYPSRYFAVAPYLTTYYPGSVALTGRFERDTSYYNMYQPRLEDMDLPTRQMLAMALPEGVLMPGGSVQGFLYFENVGDLRELLRLEVDLVNAGSDIQFGTISIPLTNSSN